MYSKIGIENKKNVKQNVHHLQYAILEAKRDFEITQGKDNKMNACNDNLEHGYRENREKYGPRENF
jgi:hypothetical protein